MSREIKFRVWDAEYKRWVSYTEWQSFPDDFIQYKDCNPLFELCWREDSRFTVQQYTGIKDKNGKEICEGDIVSTIYQESENEKEGQIVYSTAVGAFRVLCSNGKLLPIVTYRVIDNRPVGLINVADQVIGNIYEFKKNI